MALTNSKSGPRTQNTAAVLEYNCLYTHDLRRKQKRWQDGYLRFHTFNRRVMVYDVPRNFVGELHWSENGHPEEGSEIMLDKGGALVQICDRTGQTETDLSELRKSAKKPAAPLLPTKADTVKQKAQDTVCLMGVKPKTQLKHRSLNTLLGSGRTPLGRASLPARSPYELKNSNNENHVWESERPGKRRRMECSPLKNGAVTGPASTMAGEQRGLSEGAVMKGAAKAGRRQHCVSPLAHSPDEDRFLAGFSSDAMQAPSSPSHAVSPTVARGKSIQSTSKSSREPRTGEEGSRALPYDLTAHDDAVPHGPLSSGLKLKIAQNAPRKRLLMCQAADVSSKSAQHARIMHMPPTAEMYVGAEGEKLQTRLAQLEKKKATPKENPIKELIRPEKPAAVDSASNDLSDHAKQRESVAPPHAQPARPINAESGKRRFQKSQKADPGLNVAARGTSAVLLGRRFSPPRPTVNNARKTAAENLTDEERATSPAALQRSTVKRPQKEPPPRHNVHPPPALPTDPDPWSREAFDLFVWRPPGWNEAEWRRDDS